MEVRELDIHQAFARYEAGDAIFMDVRDPGAHAQAHIPGSQHVSDANIQQFIDEADKTKTVIVYCYMGNSSLGGAAYLMENGFADVYSMSGGFEDWRGKYPDQSA